MGKHSLRFARLLSLAAVSAAALTVTPAAAATIAPSSAAAKLVSAADVQSVVDYLASKGDMVTPGKDSDGKPLSSGQEAGRAAALLWDAFEALKGEPPVLKDP